MKGTAVITGANRGIGLEFCKQLKAAGYDVIALCRRASPELWNVGVEVYENIDVTDQEGLYDLVERLPPRNIDLLINNAGIYLRGDFEELTGESLVQEFEVNALGPLFVTKAFLPRLKKGAKVAMMSSLMGSIGDTSSARSYGYRMSKAALNMLGRTLSHELKDKGIAVILLSPGSVSTDMTFNQGRMQPNESVKGLLEQINNLTLESSGSFIHYDGRELPW